MSAKFEIKIISKKCIRIDEIILTVNKYFDTCKISDSKIMDNWEYLNFTDYYLRDDFEEVLLGNKIVTVYANINNRYDAGAQFYMNNDSFYSTLWFDTSHFSYLDTEHVNAENKVLFDNLTHIISEKNSTYDIIAVAIGIEMFVKENTDLETMMRESLNVSRWILFNIDFQHVNGFLTTIDDPQACIFTKIQ